MRLPGKLTRDSPTSRGPVVHHCRLRSSVMNSTGSREGISWPAAAIACTFASTAPSSVLRVPLSLPSELFAAT